MKTFFPKMITMVALVVVLTSCATSKKASDGYATNQTKPVTKAQSSAANRGLKIQKEECEELALENVSNPRASGNGISDNESFATNIALLDARSKLAQQLKVLVSGLTTAFNQQHSANKDLTSVRKDALEQQAYFEQFLTNTRQICKNTYIKEDGKYNVYVCVEMNEQQQKAMYNKLHNDQVIHIDFAEHQFLKRLGEAKEEYRKKQLEEYDQ